MVAITTPLHRLNSMGLHNNKLVMAKKVSTIIVKQVSIGVFQTEEQEYISLTDIAAYKNPLAPKDVVKNWLRNRGTIEFLGLWEHINNHGFKGVEFDSFLFESGSNSFTLSPSKWIESTHAIGIISKLGRGGIPLWQAHHHPCR